MIGAMFRSIGSWLQNDLYPWLRLTLMPQGRTFFELWRESMEDGLPYHIASMSLAIVLYWTVRWLVRGAS